jgi:hypothetical protein
MAIEAQDRRAMIETISASRNARNASKHGSAEYKAYEHKLREAEEDLRKLDQSGSRLMPLVQVLFGLDSFGLKPSGFASIPCYFRAQPNGWAFL